MKKKFTLLLLICILSALNINATIYNGSCGTNVNYSLNTETGLLSITGTGAMANYSSSSSIPWYSNTSFITAVEISNGVTSIGYYAFRDCSKLTSVTIPNSVRSIGNRAFNDCSGLTSVTIPNSVRSIGWNAFDGCSGLTSVTIPNSVTSIGNEAFYDCSGLTSVTIPNSVTSIGASAFDGTAWYNNQPDGLVYAGLVAYNYKGTMPENTSITIKEGTLGIASNAFWDCSGLTSITIPNSVTSIGSEAFSYCRGLTSVTIPNSVTSIEHSAFNQCSSLTSVTIPNSVTSIGSGAFKSCSSLTSVISEIEEPFAFGTNAFNGISSSCTLGVPYGTRDAYIAAGWTTNVFKGGIEEIISGSCGDNVNYSLNTETGALSITGTGAMTNYNSTSSVPWYSNRSSITAVEISDGVTSIGNNAFSYCRGLTSVTIPNSVTSIGVDAFINCSGLTSVTIPNSVTSIGNYAFYGCSGLTSVISQIKKPFAFGTNAFNGISSSCALTVPYGTRDAYIAAGWTTDVFKGGIEEIKIISGSCGENVNYSLNTETGLLRIYGTGAMEFDHDDDSYYDRIYYVPWYSNRLSITAVEISDGVTSIGEEAFEGCSNLTSVTIPNSVTDINRTAFSDCSSLTSITIPNSVTEIGRYVFDGCTGLTSVHITDLMAWCNILFRSELNFSDGSNPLAFAHHLYLNGNEIKDLVIPNGVLSIRDHVFEGCSGLTSVTIPNGVTRIGLRAFEGCSGLTSVNIPNSVTSIGEYAFHNCSGLTSVNIGNAVKTIGGVAFNGCSGLTSVTIPNSVTSIGYQAFQGCSSLTSVISEIKEPFAFGTYAFYGISSSCTLTVPRGTRDAYIAAGWTTYVFKGGIVEMAPDAMNINMSANEIGTYCSPYDLDFSGVSGLKAYIMSGFSPSTSTLVLTPVTMVPAGTGLLLKGAEGNYEVPCTTTDMYYTNLLKGVTTATAIDPTDGEYTNFILSNGAHGIGFYTLSESGELAANKAYLQLPTASVASLSRAMRLVFADDITGIDEKKAETKKEDNIFYDLQGRRVDNPTQGLYIVNGKKVFINK